MKCACGYEYEFNHVDQKLVKGDEEFIDVNVTITVSEPYGPDRSVTVCACPKCGTLKLA